MAKVLVIDDDSHFRGVIERIILRSYTYSVKTAATEEEAWEELSKNSYDLVLLDLYIDGKKSWDTLRRIRTLPSPPVVIVVSCEDLKENAEYALAMGATDFVAKPIDFGRLKLSVDTALDWRKENFLSRRTGDEEKDREITEEMTLLVLVREEDRREVLAAFESPGFRVLEAKDPSDAAETAKTEKIDGVVVDMASGVCPAANLVRVLSDREGERLRLPVIALVEPDPDTILAVLKGGADDYIGLPVDGRILAGKVTAHVRQRRAYERRLSEALAGAVKDRLTDAYKGDYFLVRLGEEIRRSKRHGRNMALAIVGLGGNGGQGIFPDSPGGDRILSEVSRALRGAFRDSDVLGRWGKDGFAVILPEATADRIRARAGSIRAVVEERVAHFNGGREGVSCFMGLASLPDRSTGSGTAVMRDSPDTLIGMANIALLRAQTSDEERVAVFEA